MTQSDSPLPDALQSYTPSTDQHQPFIAHIQALRTCFIKSFLALMITSIIAYGFAKPIFTILVLPLTNLLGNLTEAHKLIYTNLTEVFVTYLKVALFAGFMVSFPYIAMQMWQFISPGLFAREKKLFKILLFIIPFCFIIGTLFAYFIVLPTAFTFFLSFETTINNVPLQLESKVSEYLSLIMRLIIAFGMSFQLPVILAGLAWLKILTAQALIKGWRFAVLGITVISAIITPPDALSMILLAVPLLILYTVSIFIVKQIERKKHHA